MWHLAWRARSVAAHSRTLAREERSRCAVSMAASSPSSATISRCAASAFSTERHSSTTVAPRLASAFAAKKPSPVFEPVTNAVLPACEGIEATNSS